MKKSHTYIAALMGFGSGAAGLAASAACAGGSCLSCFGCVAGGVGVFIAALAARVADVDRTTGRSKPGQRRGVDHGMAQSCR